MIADLRMVSVFRALVHGLAAVPVWTFGGAGPTCACATWLLAFVFGTKAGVPEVFLAGAPAFVWGAWFGWTKEP